MTLRAIEPSDEPALEEFLSGHRDSSMFLRSNLERGGSVYRGKPYQAVYLAAFDGARVCGVVAHTWAGMLLVQAPEGIEELARACVRESGREVTGFAGPLQQVARARGALGLNNVVARKDALDGLYVLELAELRVPIALSSGAIVCRAPLPTERELLIAWRRAYEIEALGASDTEETRKNAENFLNWQWGDEKLCVALESGRLVSLSAFNATLPDIVQLGGIYTPPELRGRGYAKASVAGSLRVAIARGASRAVLFTANPSAIRCYESLGFRRTGDYALVLLR
ncbi:MAG TPA: GNAT family N-acetyltransferase [Polyangiaceae bacterium]